MVIHSWTMRFPFSSSMYLPEMYPPQAVNFPPTLGAPVAGDQVNSACFFGLTKASYTSEGLPSITTPCLIDSNFSVNSFPLESQGRLN